MKCFIIHNPNDELSLRLMNESINSCKEFGLSPVPFSGTFKDSVLEKIKKYKLVPSIYKSSPSLGEQGCFISHYELWAECVKDNVPYLILEHDITMKSALPTNILETFDEVLNLDVCGSLRKDMEPYLKCMAKTGIGKVKKLFTDIKLPAIEWKTLKTYHVVGAHAYIVKPIAAKKLIDKAHEVGLLPVDVHINSYYTNISIIEPAPFRTCDFMIDRKNRVKYSSTKRN